MIRTPYASARASAPRGEDRGHVGREATQGRAVGVDDATAPRDLTLLRCVRLHLLFILFAQGRYPLQPLFGRSVSCVLSVFHGDEAQAVCRCARTRHRAILAIDDLLEGVWVDLPTSDPEERPDDRTDHSP